MDLDDDAIPPPIRRFPQSSSRTRKIIIDDDDSDEAAPPPISRSRSSSLGTSRTPSYTSSTPPVPQKSPLRPQQTPAPLRPRTSPLTGSTRNFSYPSRSAVPSPLNPAPKPSPAPKPLYYAPKPKAKPIAARQSTRNAKFPPTIRRWSSLETIDSIPTVDEPTLDEDNVRNSFASSTDRDSFYLGEDEDRPSGTPSLTDSLRTASTESSRVPAPSPLFSNHDRPHNGSASSLLRRLKPKKAPEPLLEPDHLKIQRKVSVDQMSERDAASSNSDLTISSGGPSSLGGVSRVDRNEEWKSSTFDVSQLSEAELKKCKKKGINPALYAEMRAARKGRWVGALTGNTIL